MTTATIDQTKVENERKRYLCGLSPLAPKAFLEIPVQTNRGAEGKPRFKAVQFALSTTHYRDEADMHGLPRFGRVESLTKDEIEQIWEFLSHRVVRWFGKNKKDQYKPTIDGERPEGYGPNRSFSNGKVLDKRDERYLPNHNDEGLEKYIVLRPLTPQDEGVVDHNIPMEGGRQYYEDQLAAALKMPQVDEDKAALNQRILELEAMVKKLTEQQKIEDDAVQSEAIDKRSNGKKRR